MRSAIGSRALTIVEELFKAPKFVNDNQARMDFVASMLPQDDISAPPLIYADPTSLTGAFRNPLFLRVFASFVKHCKPALEADANARPIGGIGLCAAGLERALRLHATGTNQKTAFVEEAKIKRASGNKATVSKGLNFDNTWSATARSYTISASKLTDKKWKEIYRAVQPYLAEDVGDTLTSLRPTDIDNPAADPRANIVLSDDDDDNDNAGLDNFDAPPDESLPDDGQQSDEGSKILTSAEDCGDEDCGSEALFGDNNEEEENSAIGAGDNEAEDGEGDEDEGDDDDDGMYA